MADRNLLISEHRDETIRVQLDRVYSYVHSDTDNRHELPRTVLNVYEKRATTTQHCNLEDLSCYLRRGRIANSHRLTTLRFSAYPGFKQAKSLYMSPIGIRGIVVNDICRQTVAFLYEYRTRTVNVAQASINDSGVKCNFVKVDIQQQLNSAYDLSINIHNEQILENRYVLSKIIVDCIKFCCAFQLALRGHD
ncbi:hypothetical protein ANN_08461 [Periplaneta americana]|uniref:Uncharacterized protein n=1 Tax=Periplaneta americana TaxID=6978 RepID=A0ABQ8T1H9_PERAM|nr:hypothetical protein ANN_08461 [Periplaneta americana]